MKVTLRQSGGVALGTKIREAQEDTNLLPADEAARLKSLVEQSGILEAEGGRAPRARDAFSFEIIIEADDGSAMKDDWDISTGDGSISFQIPRTFNAEVDASSRDGRVRSDIDGLTASSDEDDDRGTLRGRIGSGGHTVTLRSGDGAITVLNR